MRAASSRPRSRASSASRMARTWKGKVKMALASTAPVQRNTSTMPNWSLRKAPTPPRVPKMISRMNPIATGGSTSGRCTMPSSKVAPAKAARQDQGGGDGERQRHRHRDGGDFQAEQQRFDSRRA